MLLLFLFAAIAASAVTLFVASRRQRDRKLEQYRQRLQEDVAARTAELVRVNANLTAANEALLSEIAERKRTEDKLRESEELSRLITENVADLIAVLDLEGRRVYNSPSY